MTIPNLITTHQKKVTVTKLQKAISVINQAYKLSVDELGEGNQKEVINTEDYFNTYLAPYIKVLTYCSSAEVCGYKSNYPFSNLKGDAMETALVSPASRVAFYTPDGYLYIIMTATGSSTGLNSSNRIYVDINGRYKPNQIGKDVFVLERIPDGGGVQPYGYNLADSKVDTNCKVKSTISNTCAEKIRRAGWKIEKDYPW